MKVRVLSWAPLVAANETADPILRKVAEGETGALGDTSTLADPAVVDNLVRDRGGRAPPHGGKMTRIFGVVLIGVALLAGAVRAETPCKLNLIAEFPVEYDSGELVVEAAINGTPLKMTVDTGSMLTFVYRDAAAKLGLKPKQNTRITIYGVGGSDKFYEAAVNELRVGNLLVRNVNLAVTGYEQFEKVGGSLGSAFLLQDDIEFDVPEGKIRLFKAVGCEGDQVVYWGKAYSVLSNDSPSPEYGIRLNVKLSGTTASATLDSGFSSSFVTSQAASRYADHSIPVEPGGKVIGTGKQPIESNIATFPSFSFGDETIKNARLRVADLFETDRDVFVGSRIPYKIMLPPVMFLGADFLHAHRVYVSHGQRKVYVSFMGGPVFDTREARPSASARVVP